MMETARPEEEKIIKDIKKIFRLKNTKLHCNQRYTKSVQASKRNLKQLKIEYSEILRILLSMKKKKKIIINQ